QDIFLRVIMVPDLTFGELCRVEALIRQRYSSYFGRLRFRLHRMELHPVGVIQTTATLSLTITEVMLRFVFLHLLDQTLVTMNTQSTICPCVTSFLVNNSLRFAWNELGGRVARFESTVDLLTTLLRILGNVEDVGCVFNEAVVTPEYLRGVFPVRLNSYATECS
ncbi:hypothetical protein PHMEG_0001621, partial [Phytophthora megakarya]